MVFAQRQICLQRTKALLEGDPRIVKLESSFLPANKKRDLPKDRFERYLRQADCSLRASVVLVLCLLSGIFAAVAGLQITNAYFAPLSFFAGAYLPFVWLERRVVARASAFAEDYPTVLLATASSLKAGMTVFAALERSTRLLQKESISRKEVERLLEALTRGDSKEKALQAFGAGIRQPDLELFRSAFCLVLENGGRFAPTLERLARVCRDRTTLIHTAQVSTATMRMTANILLGVAPLIMMMIAARTGDFWSIVTSNPIANLFASIGVAIIGCSYVMLRRMSSFKP